MTRVKVLPLWRAPFIHVTSKEYSDGTGGTTWKAMREERPVTPNFDPIRQAIDSVSCSRAFVWLFMRVHGWKKTEVNIRHTGRATCDPELA